MKKAKTKTKTKTYAKENAKAQVKAKAKAQAKKSTKTKADSSPKTTLRLNGKKAAVTAPPMKRLLDTLREDLGLTGTKEGCGEGECGACTVLVDGAAVNSCLVATCQVDGCDVQTVEGMARGNAKVAARLHRLQRAFLDHGAAQCGICTPGMLMAALALPKRSTLDEIRAGLAGNLCRCTGYMKIYDAVAQFLDGERR
jgi:aerobic-type carbon monoxide dehydrogenase small subunit (CoxS/CutS family)